MEHSKYAFTKLASGNSFSEKVHQVGEDLEKARIHLDTPLRNMGTGAVLMGAGYAIPAKKFKSLKYGLLGGGALLAARGVIKDSNQVGQRLKEFDARTNPTIIMTQNDRFPEDF